MLDQYLRAADTLLLAGRMAAAKMVHVEFLTDDLIDLYESVERTARRRLWNQLDVDGGDEALVSLGGLMAAHTLHAQLQLDGDNDLAELVGEHLPVLWNGDLTQRLAAARALASWQDAAPGMRELATMLRREPGQLLVNASGQLVRRVVATGSVAGVGEAWYGVFGTYLLVAGRAVRPAATNMVRTGREKKGVAARAGISRTTLDSWLGAGREH